MSIRITMVSGEKVNTIRHTYEQAKAAKEAGVGIEVGGSAEVAFELDVDPDHEVPPVRTLYPEGIASIEDVPA